MIKHNERFVIEIQKEKWRSPAYMFNLFEIRLYRTSYLSPSVIAYCFKLTLFGFKIKLEIRRKKVNEWAIKE